MSKGKEFPPRRKIPAAGVYYKGPTMAWRIFGQLGEDELEFISAAEHSHLLAEARSQGRAEAFREVAQQMRRESGFQHAQKRADYYEAKAAEGAIDG